MAFKFFILCDEDGCNSEKQIDQPGQLPLGWVHLQYSRPHVALIGNGHTQQSVNQMVQKIFCSMRCANKHTKHFVQEGAKK